ncbi:MAG: hypothetical protein AAGD43_24770 [Pseudomonadota bacterium]
MAVSSGVPHTKWNSSDDPDAAANLFSAEQTSALGMLTAGSWPSYPTGLSSSTTNKNKTGSLMPPVMNS